MKNRFIKFIKSFADIISLMLLCTVFIILFSSIARSVYDDTFVTHDRFISMIYLALIASCVQLIKWLIFGEFYSVNKDDKPITEQCMSCNSVKFIDKNCFNCEKIK